MKKERVLYRNDGAVFCYTDALAARPDMRPGYLGEPPPKPKIPMDELAPEQVTVKAEVKEALPEERVVLSDEPLTPELLDRLDKAHVMAWAQERYGKKLDKRKGVEKLRSDLWRLAERRKAKVQDVLKNAGRTTESGQ